MSRRSVDGEARAVARQSGLGFKVPHVRDDELSLASVLDAGELGWFRHDVSRGRLECSPRFLANLGLHLDAEISSFDELLPHIHPEDRTSMREATERAVASGHGFDLEYRVVQASGDPRWMLARVRVFRQSDGNTHLAGVMFDLTEKKRAEAERERLVAELAAERARLHTLLQHLPAAVAMADRAGRIVEANPALERLFPRLSTSPAMADVYARWRVFDATGRPLPSDRRPFERALQGETVCLSDIRYVDDLGEKEGWIRVSSAPIRDDVGTVTGAVLIVFDVDREKRAEEALRSSERRGHEFERQLIGIVSHDLRNPLNTITLAAVMLERSAGLGERSMKNVTRIRRAGERATRMIHDLLDFTRARLGAGIPVQRRPTELGALFRGIVDDTRIGHPDRRIYFHAAGELTGTFDPDRLAQVLTNLLDNALQYGPPGSPVRVDVHGTAREVVLAVHNDGPPIAPDVLPLIFEPLQRGGIAADSAGRSVGLGLYIVKHLVAAHGGQVTVHSAEGKGTELRVELPR